MEKNILKILFNIVIACVIIIVMFNVVCQLDDSTQELLAESVTTNMFTDFLWHMAISIYFIIGLLYSLFTNRGCLISPLIFITLPIKVVLWPLYILIDCKNTLNRK